MESVIVRNMQPEFSPVAVIWSNTIPDDALQFKKGKFGCILYLFAEASQRGKVAGGNRESITCTGGRAALGLGVGFDASDELLDRYAAVFSKGLKSASNQEAFGEFYTSMVSAGTAVQNWPRSGFFMDYPATIFRTSTFYSSL